MPSSISGISGAGGLEQLRQLTGDSGLDLSAIRDKLAASGVDASQLLERSGDRGDPRAAAGEQIAAALDAQGVDSETQSQIKADIESAVDNFSGSPEELRAEVEGVLNEHGVDTEALAATLDFPGKLNQLESVLQQAGGGTLESLLANYDSTGSESSDPVQALLDALFAYDEEA